MVFVMNVLKKLWGKYLKRHHEFVLCKYDRRAQSLRSVIQANSMVVLVRPFGILQSSQLQGFTRPSELAISIIRALLGLFKEMHSAGYSLDGKLLIENLHWLPSSNKIKISGLEKSFLPEWRLTRAENDFTSGHNFIRDVLFEGYPVPSELHGLMELLVKDSFKYEDLILNNIILLDDVQKIGEYITCFQQLQQVQKHSEIIYRVALTYIKERRRWKKDVSGNSALLAVLKHKGGAAFVGKADNEGPVVFGRHCCNHLLDYSVDEITKAILFTLADEFEMIEPCLPGLFGEVQKALFEVTQILFPKELSMLRVTNACGGRMAIYHKENKNTKKSKHKAQKGAL